MAVLNVNDFLGTYDMEVREDGVIDADVVEAFTSGHCHSFALALHRATGWEIVGALWNEWDRSEFVCGPECDHKGHAETLSLDAWPFHDDEYVLVPEHVLCRDERGTLWDINGREVFGGCYDDAQPIPVELVEAHLCGVYRTVEPEIAGMFIDAWMDAHRPA